MKIVDPYLFSYTKQITGFRTIYALYLNIILIYSQKNKYVFVSVSVYYVAVRTIVLSHHGSNLARTVIVYDIIHR